MGVQYLQQQQQQDKNNKTNKSPLSRRAIGSSGNFHEPETARALAWMSGNATQALTTFLVNTDLQCKASESQKKQHNIASEL